MRKIGILGYGEIGKAIHKFYREDEYDVSIEDLSYRYKLGENLEVLHICIPYSRKFTTIVFKHMCDHNPKLTIIHSTVKVGTTKKINNKFITPLVVHSPCMGIHPNLYEGIKTFTKFIGSDDMFIGLKVQRHFDEIGISSEVMLDSNTTELGKLLDTTYYGLCISYHGYAYKLCKKLDLDFKQVVTKFNETYNKGYTKLDKSNVVRPVLNPPDKKIGGHCIVPNVKLLKEQFGNDNVLKSILKYK